MNPQIPMENSCCYPGNVLNATLPLNHCQLPPWVLPVLLNHYTGAISRRELAIHVNCYLSYFRESSSHAMELLRRVNWGLLPLIWQPAVLVDAPVSVSPEESTRAQSRFIHNIVTQIANEVGDDNKSEHWTCVQREALKLLEFATGSSCYKIKGV
jgi:hypothetical protein